MGFFAYYLIWFGLAFALRHPAIALVALFFFLLRNRLPDPLAFARGYARARKLEQQVALNPANVTARRDLARTYLEGFRPGRALAFLEEARRLRPNDAELLFLAGCALARLRRHEEAVDALIGAVHLDGAVGREALYITAGDSLVVLDRLADARDAFEHAIEANSSSVEAYVKLARVARKQRAEVEAKKALDEALMTYRTLPAYARRRQLRWWWRAHLERLFGRA